MTKTMSWVWAVLATTPLLVGCGPSEIDESLVFRDRQDQSKAVVMREDNEPVTGSVVTKNAEGRVTESRDYVDGFPSGWYRTWYDNGQMRSESHVMFRSRETNPKSWGSYTIGTSRAWCEDGTLKQENTYDEEGRPKGEHRSWTCKGELVNLTTHPSGPFRQASEAQDGSVWVFAEGTRGEDGKLIGEHKKYHQNGKVALVEHWKDGELDGKYQTFDEEGNVTADGSYAAGAKIGTWRTMNNGWETVQDYDLNNFVDLDYAGPFMQAAGLQPNNSGWYAKLPLAEFRVDLDKLRYYVTESLVDPKKKLNNGPAPNPFVSSSWTYPYVRASRAALDTLVELGADPKAVDSDNRSRLHHCMFSLADNGVCNVAEVKRLIDLGLPVDQPDVGDYTPLHDLVLTAWNWRWAPSPAVRLEVAKLLLDAGANPDRLGGRDMLAPHREGMSPLMVAAHAKQYELAKLLLERSKNPTATTKLGYNLIHLVFLDLNMQQFDLRMKDDAKAFIELAVSKGVDPGAKVGDAGSMKEIAQRSGAIELAKFFSGLSVNKT